MNCVFCKIVDGEIDSTTIYEDDKFRVILDLNPVTKGHALILSKKHYADLYESSDKLAAKAIILAKKMVKMMTEVLRCDGYNVFQNNGAAAGQTIFHFHVHLIPRYKGDQVGVIWEPGSLTEEDKQDILEKISNKLN